MKKLLILAVLLCIPGCSSIIEGTSQEILINTTPEKAKCVLKREGVAIATVDQTPGAATVKKSKEDIQIECTKKGYQKATYFNKSGVAGATAGNILAGGLIGWGIDSASGADNHYDSPVNITMVKK